MNGLGVRSAVMLVPSTYLASDVATYLLQIVFLNDQSPTIFDPYVRETVDLSEAMTKQKVPEAPANCFKRI